MAVFRSAMSNLRVSFPPEQFGYGEGVEKMFDSQGKVVAKPAPFKPVKFELGRADVSDSRLKMMKKHPGNKGNGGMLFWEEQAEVTSLIDGVPFRGVSAETPEDGISDQDKKLLALLERACVRFAPTETLSICDATAALVERFKIRGIEPATTKLDLRRIKARVIELMGLLKDKGIWDGDAGQGTVEGSPGVDERSVVH